LRQVVDDYHETLKNDAVGLAYLEKRGLAKENRDTHQIAL
jgi:hypothetical protein